MDENPYRAPQAERNTQQVAPPPVSPLVRAIGITALMLFVVFPLLGLLVMVIDVIVADKRVLP